MRRIEAWCSVVCAATAAFATTAGDSALAAGSVCLWGPLQQWLLPEPRCSASASQAERSPSSGDGRAERQRPGNATEPAKWSGPNLCVGDYCVYSNPAFGGGIVLVTTDDNAKRIAQLSPTAVVVDSSATTDAAFAAQAVPGKGIGLVATRPIRRGELIMAESPAMVVHKRVLEDRQGLYIRSLELAVPKLPARRRRAFMRQGMQGSGTGGHKIADILFTNSFQTAVSGGGVENAAGFHYSNFPNVSRLNHDCRPNLVFHIDENLTHHTHAVRDIAAGEELSISYGDQLEPTAQRQARMRSSWGFSCTCAHCSLANTEAAASEKRIAAIVAAEAELGDVSASSKASLKLVEELLRMYEEERLQSKIAGAYTLAALNYNLFGKEKLAKKYAALAADAVAWEFGPDSVDAQGMRELERDPKAHWSWRGRLRK